MLGGLAAAFVKDLRLLARDRAGLVFLTIAPVLVITVAGLSLATLYGADPRGSSAYLLPVADEDGGRLGRALAERLAAEGAVNVESVASAADARVLVQRQRSGAALVIPAGTSGALAAGEPGRLVLYTDPVKYLEVANVRGLVQELRHGIETAARRRAEARLEKATAHAAAARRRLERASSRLEEELRTLAARLATVRDEAERRATESRRRAEAELRAAAARREAAVRDRLAAEIAPLLTFLTDLQASQRAFGDWLAAARAKAGRFADELPPPPSPPVVPPAVASLATATPEEVAARVVPPDSAALDLSLPTPSLPAPPPLPALALPAAPELPAVRLPGTLAIAEESVTGAPRRLNTFDQNVPGFSVTFLMIGMLFGVSLGLLDERDWGTLERLRAMPVPFAATLVAKLLARFVVGVAQMLLLLAVGRAAFGVSLGPEPWALLLPTIGIAFAGTAFGLIVAGAATTREAVLPLGAVVVVTMAAMGGCWWPIDLEPRWMQTAALAFPTRWVMAAYNDLMIRRQSHGAAIVPTGVLLAYGATYLAAGLLLFRRHVR